jgi:uncharacterized protein YjiS (DUF1127 family)
MTSSAAVAATRPAPTSAAGTSPVLHSIGSALLSAIQRAAAARARAHTRKVLGSLDDAALKDIGLVRNQIDCVEHDPRYGTRYARPM